MLSKQIRAHKEANPQLSAKQIAATLKTSPAYVYQVLASKTKAKKEKPVDKVGQPSAGQQTLREEMDRLHAEIANLTILDEVNTEIITRHESEIEQLKSDIIGYRAVISYLQGQLDGATV